MSKLNSLKNFDVILIKWYFLLMKNKANKKVILLIIFSSVLIGLVYNYFYAKGIPYFRTEEKITWADSSLFNNNIAKKEKTPDRLFSEMPPEKVHYLSNSTKRIDSKLQLINLNQTFRLFSSDTVIFVDARDKWDFAEGHIPGSINIPQYNFEKDNELLKNIPKDKTIVVYCGGDDCDASLSLAKELQKLNYTTLYVFSGGWSEWSKAGYKIQKG